MNMTSAQSHPSTTKPSDNLSTETTENSRRVYVKPRLKHRGAIHTFTLQSGAVTPGDIPI